MPLNARCRRLFETELSEMSDKELEAVKNGDKKAFDGLYERFLPLIKKEAAAAVNRSEELKGHYDEIAQEAVMALYDAATSFCDGKSVTFGLYAKICIHNRIISYVRRVKAQKRRAERVALVAEESGRGESPEELIELVQRNGELNRFLEEALSGYEKKVFSLYLQKKSYVQIAEALGKTEKSVDNALFRVKSKIRGRFY